MATDTKNDAPVKTEAKPKETKEQIRLRRFPILSEAEAAKIAAVARPASSPCLCGCGGMTKGRFVPGHDATLKERLANTANHGKGAQAESAKAALATFGW